MNVADIRKSFRCFAGQDRYCKFVRTINQECQRKGRLFFWQEQLWREFVSKTDGAINCEAIMAAFRICDVHDDELTDAISNREELSEIRDTLEYDQALESLFPFATDKNWACSQCRSERQRWVSENSDLCRILRKPISYEAWVNQHLAQFLDQNVAAKMRRQLEPQIKERTSEIAAQMQPGDELWEWDGGGWHRFAGRGGIAIVRNGQIVKKWCESRS
jgi:hypothetical protein